MSRKDFLNSHVLSWRQKVYSDWEDVTSSGRAFQVFGLVNGKARLTTVDRLTGGHQKTIGACRTKRPSARKTVCWHERSKVRRCTSVKNIHTHRASTRRKATRCGLPDSLDSVHFGPKNVGPKCLDI